MGVFALAEAAARRARTCVEINHWFGESPPNFRISISVKSKSIRLIFGRIDCSHRVLEAQQRRFPHRRGRASLWFGSRARRAAMGLRGGVQKQPMAMGCPMQHLQTSITQHVCDLDACSRAPLELSSVCSSTAHRGSHRASRPGSHHPSARAVRQSGSAHRDSAQQWQCVAPRGSSSHWRQWRTR